MTTPTIELKAEQIEGKYYLLSDEKPTYERACVFDKPIYVMFSRVWHKINDKPQIIKAVGIEKRNKGKTTNYISDTGNTIWTSDGDIIIASDDKSLPLPFIQWPDEDEEAKKKLWQLAHDAAFDKKIDSENYSSYQQGYWDGFRERNKSNPKKFDEKDMVGFAEWIATQDGETKLTLIDNGWFYDSDKDGDQELSEEFLFKQYLQSIAPIITSVEVVAEEVGISKTIKISKLYYSPEGSCVKVLKENYK